MGIFHFLNVGRGDCSVIQHASGNVTVMDVCNARAPVVTDPLFFLKLNQNDYPIDPVAYLQNLGVQRVFRYIQSHPDMDHLDGLVRFWTAFRPVNFWDTDNKKKLDDFSPFGGFDERDWRLYVALRDRQFSDGPRRMVRYSGDRGPYWNQDDVGGSGDGLYVLAPTRRLSLLADETEDYNDCSYVILYRAPSGGRILLAGDAHDETLQHVVNRHRDLVANIDVLVAPHHGRHSDRCFDFLKILRPKLTLFGSAPSEHLAYEQYAAYGTVLTNNRAGTIVVDATGEMMHVYVAGWAFADREYPQSTYVSGYGRHLGYVTPEAVRLRELYAALIPSSGRF